MKYLATTITFFIFLLFIPNSTIAHTGDRETEKPQVTENKTLNTNYTKDSQNKEGAPNAHQHENHVHNHGANEQDAGYEKFIKWIGNFHPIAIHFPIALIIITGFSELFSKWFPSPIFDYSSRFMIIAAAITATPAALLGLAYGYDASYSGIFIDIFWWHRFFGISTAILAAMTALLKELYVRKKIEKPGYYYTSLIASILFVTTTGYLGGEMTFGLFNLFP